VISSYSVTHGAASVIGPNVTPPTATTENEDDGLLSSMMMFASSLLPQMYLSQLPWEMVGPKLIVKVSVHTENRLYHCVGVVSFSLFFHEKIKLLFFLKNNISQQRILPQSLLFVL
jgi:hypothetical protein